MKTGITHKLFLAMLAACIIAVASMVVSTHWQIRRGFQQYVDSIEKAGMAKLAARLEQEFAARNDWQRLKSNPRLWQRMIAESMHVHPPGELTPPSGRYFPGPPPGDPPPSPLPDGQPPDRLPPHMARLFDQRLMLMTPDRQLLIGSGNPAESDRTVPLMHGGQVAGYLAILPPSGTPDPLQQRFLQQQKTSLLVVAVVVVMLAGGLSLLLASRLVRPVHALAAATHRLAAGDHTVRVTAESRDEIGRLAGDFNQLAATLEKNDQARRQWIADISHELRTPLAILRGEIEAIQDGVHPCTQESIASLHGEVLRLGRLVDDLYQLSLYDLCAMSFKKSGLDCAALLAEALEVFHGEFSARGIQLETAIPVAPVPVLADGERLHQLFANLLENSLRYTDSGGKLSVQLEPAGSSVVIRFDDSAPGVPPEALERLFDRLYRVEGSRSRALGGAGLGLSICRNIVEAHGGRITAAPSSLDGLSVTVILPLLEQGT